MCATGLVQGVPFLPGDVQSRLFNERGNFMLYRRGTKIFPLMHNVDEVLGDLGVNIPKRVRAAHWLNPINPAAYRRITPWFCDDYPTRWRPIPGSL
ncbi:hypothetical protein [Kibdelosporangium aridum]|uniref:Uncharacterized protein n=1 Tax=Kibdelosporangium aridum TaxID=2030 RepID=A0A1Y5Y7Z5_KIBAR|nr:hypothetical protein [Kibdelosporangium aridum]SMD26020.1 hypothetical protein SAMN05661093_09598 [Kibdelosporangium aridum]